MLTVTTIAAVRARRAELRREGRSVALVPTMGALHAGHLELVRRGRELADEAWASVFVNPTQFGPGEDFERYPRDLEADRAALETEGAALLFAPAAKELYPRPAATVVDVPGLTAGLCGARRPGHFRGVALVVAKLFNIVQPEVAIFGAKDAQQAAVIRRMALDLDFPVRVVVAPTVREPDGLAMSSRNRYLSAAERHAALALSRALRRGAQTVLAGERSARAIEAAIAAEFACEGLARLEYAAAADPDTLEPLEAVAGRALLAVAAKVGATRLIDNLEVEAR